MDKNYANYTQDEKTEALAKAVLEGTPEETDRVYKALGEVEFTAEILLYACRHRGLDYVKALVENGASFRFEMRYDNTRKIRVCYLSFSSCVVNISDRAKKYLFTLNFPANYWDRNGPSMKLLSFEERLEIFRYLAENCEKVNFNPQDTFFYSVLANDTKMYEALKNEGYVFSDMQKEILLEGKRSHYFETFVWAFAAVEDGQFFDFMNRLRKEVGSDEPFHFTEGISYHFNGRQQRFYRPEFFDCILANFKQNKMNKKHIMKELIRGDHVELLPIVEKYGWLKMPRKRDEMIEFAVENDKTECSAWLLDFKNRTANLAEENIKREKKLQSELNADPNSVSVLKKIWSYGKQEDGTLIITSFKGGRSTDVIVPEKIGKSTVAAVADYAFSPDAPRVGANQFAEPALSRKAMTSLTLPPSIRAIGKKAFIYCESLVSVNIPDGVTRLEDSLFIGCKSLKKIEIPPSVSELGTAVFAACRALEEIIVPEGVSEIPDSAFKNCEVLKKITLPSTLKVIKDEAFGYCAALEEIIIPEGTEEIERLVFIECVNLKRVELPASLKKIKNRTGSGFSPQTIFERIPEIPLVILPKGSYAEKYCKRNNIAYQYKED